MNEKTVTVLTVVLLVVIILAGGGLSYYLHFVVLDEKEQELAKLKAQVASDRKKQKQIPQLKEEIKALEAKRAELEPRIPDLTRVEYDEFANLLDQLRRESGVSVSRAGWVKMRAPRPVPGRPARRIPKQMHQVAYDLDVAGTFYQILRYIHKLEKQKRFINVDSFSVSPGPGAPEGGGPPVRDMQVKIFSFTYRPKEADKPDLKKEERDYATTTPPPK